MSVNSITSICHVEHVNLTYFCPCLCRICRASNYAKRQHARKKLWSWDLMVWWNMRQMKGVVYFDPKYSSPLDIPWHPCRKRSSLITKFQMLVFDPDGYINAYEGLLPDGISMDSAAWGDLGVWIQNQIGYTRPVMWNFSNFRRTGTECAYLVSSQYGPLSP